MSIVLIIYTRVFLTQDFPYKITDSTNSPVHLHKRLSTPSLERALSDNFNINTMGFIIARLVRGKKAGTGTINETTLNYPEYGHGGKSHRRKYHQKRKSSKKWRKYQGGWYPPLDENYRACRIAWPKMKGLNRGGLDGQWATGVRDVGSLDKTGIWKMDHVMFCGSVC